VVVDVHPEALDRVLASPATACACAKSWWEKQGWLAAKGYGGGYRKLRMRGEARGSESGDGVGVTRAFDACCAFGGFGADLTQRYVNGEVLDITAHDIVPPLVEPSRTDHTRSLLQEVRRPTRALPLCESSAFSIAHQLTASAVLWRKRSQRRDGWARRSI
jgi:hypothetical protein